MFIDENDDQSGVNAISLVESPAIEKDFVALSKHKIELKPVDDKKKILMGAALVPNKPIYRNQEGKEFYIGFSKSTVRKISERFFKLGNQSNTTEEHQVQLEGNTVVESWIKEDDTHDKTALHGVDAPVGSWVISMKVTDDQYEKAQSGQIKGFSIEGYFADLATKQKKQEPSLRQALIDLIEEHDKENVTK